MKTPRFDARSLVTGLSLLTFASACATTAGVRPQGGATSADTVHQVRFTGDFHEPLGVQLWTFRDQAKTDPRGMLQMVRRMGFTHVETAGLYDLSAEQFADAVKQANLRVTSMHVGYDDLKNHPETVIANAKTLGASYVGIAWYPHAESGFTEADARRAIADFNEFGRTLKNAGIQFFYHNHGYEPVPYGDGTLLDLIIANTDPQLVKFELDVLWAWVPAVDPVALIQKYPGRFKLMHIKDMKPGVARGSLAGGLPAEQQAVIGSGQVNWGALMEAAVRDGLQEYYIEDETTDPVTNVPRSIAFMETLKYHAR